MTSRSSDSDEGANGRMGASAGQTSPLAFTQEGVQAGENGEHARTQAHHHTRRCSTRPSRLPLLACSCCSTWLYDSKPETSSLCACIAGGTGTLSWSSSSCSTGSNGNGGGGGGGTTTSSGGGSTGGSGSLQTWMGMPKSPILRGKGGGGGGKSQFASTNLSPAQESEEIADDNDDDDDSDGDTTDDNDDSRWEDLEEEEGWYGSTEDDDEEHLGGLIGSTMSKFDQLEASWRMQLRSSGFRG